MTGADAIREAAAVDPRWARKEMRRKLILGGVTVGALVAIAVGVIALVIGVHNERELVKVQHSACQTQPAGAECQRAKAESSEAANLYVTCIPFRKAGYVCPKAGSPAAKRQARHRAAEEVTPSTGNSPSSPPSPHTGGAAEVDTSPAGVNESPEKLTPHHGSAPAPQHHESSTAPPVTHESAPAPPETPTQPGQTSAATAQTVTPPTEPTPDAAAEPEHPVLSGTGAAVEHVGEGLGHTLESVGTGVNCALSPTC